MKVNISAPTKMQISISVDFDQVSWNLSFVRVVFVQCNWKLQKVDVKEISDMVQYLV